MSQVRKYMAASVPRFLRQTKLAYLPVNCVIGSRLVKGDAGVNLFFDIVMLPVPEFQRMRTNVGLQHVIAPALKAGPTFSPGFVIADAREIVVPETEPEPENFAKEHFLKIFGLAVFDASPQPENGKGLPEQAFVGARQECTKLY